MAVALRERRETLTATPRLRVTTAHLDAACARLEQRLESGERIIESARLRGEPIEHLELRWRELLRAYERLSLLAQRSSSSRAH